MSLSIFVQVYQKILNTRSWSTSMLLEKFTDSSILYIKKDINISIENGIDIFANKKRFIVLK